MEMNQTAVYMRVSSKSQDIRSQLLAINRWCQDNDFNPELKYIDHAVRSTTMDRKELRSLMQAVDIGRVTTIIMYSFDRLARTAIDGINILHGWLKQNVRVVVVNQDMDLSGEIGQMIASILLHLAQMERTRLRERQSLGIEAARARGVRIGGRVPGSYATNPERAKQLRIKGLTYKEISKCLGISLATVKRHVKIAQQSTEEANGENKKAEAEVGNS